MTLIDHYLDPVQGENESEKDYIERKQKRANTECPIILFRENEKKIYINLYQEIFVSINGILLNDRLDEKLKINIINPCLNILLE